MVVGTWSSTEVRPQASPGSKGPNPVDGLYYALSLILYSVERVEVSLVNRFIDGTRSRSF